MADLAQVGGKNASLGEMIGGLAAAGVRVPGGFATTAAGLRRIPRADGLGRAHRGAPARRSTRATWRRSRGAAPRSARWIVQAAASRTSLSKRYARIIKSLQRLPQAKPHSRCAPRPPPKTCPMPPSPASRRPSSTSAASTTCWRRSGTSSPRSTTTAPSPTGCTRASTHGAVAHLGRRAAHGAQRPRRGGVMFTLDTESGFRDVVFITSS